MRVGKWVSFDEQMVKCTALFSRGIQRYNPLKPIKHGEFFLHKQIGEAMYPPQHHVKSEKNMGSEPS